MGSDGKRGMDVLVIGCGTELRGDDAAGIAVARRLKETETAPGIDVREHQGDPAELLEAWTGRDTVLLVDAMRSGVAAATICRLTQAAGRCPLDSAGRAPLMPSR